MIRKIALLIFIIASALNFTITNAQDLTPKKLLIYYGFPSSINATFSVAGAAAEFGQYDYVVLGDGLEKNTHPDHQNTVDIMAHAAMTNTTVFGYIDLGVTTQNLTISEVKTRIDEWQVTGADGIFFDDFGYDFNTSRARQNEAVDSVHSKGMPVVANGFFVADVFGSDVDAVHNPTGTATSLEASDFYLYESHQITVGQFVSESAWKNKANALKNFQDALGFKIFSITTNDAGNIYSEDEFFYSWYSALLYGHEATSWGEYNFSAITASAPFRLRPVVNAGSAFTSDIVNASPVYSRSTVPGEIQVNTLTHTGSFSVSTPAIMYTSVPAYGSFDDLSGQVEGVVPDDYAVAVYIYVFGWWTKPTFAAPVTIIQPDGTWTADITTGSGDEFATRIAAFLIPETYTPPQMSGGGTLPQELFQNSLDNIEVTRGPVVRTIQFAGYQWQVKSSDCPVGPGPNFFSDRQEDIWVDINGYLHLTIKQRDGNWYSTEVIADTSLGYGKYVFQIQGQINLLDQNTVVGLFTWDSDAPQFNFREIDIEFSRWGIPANDNAQFVVQPYTTPANIFRYDIQTSNLQTSHSFTWTQPAVIFQSLFGHLSTPVSQSDVIQDWSYSGNDIPPSGDENTRINFWLVNGNPPSDGLDTEIVITDFEFIPIVIVDIKTWLEGPFISSGSGMSTMLKDNAVLPLIHPYGSTPWNHAGTESVAAVPVNIVDWVLVELRSAASSASKVASRAAFVKNDGSIVDLDGSSPLVFSNVSLGDYYIVVYHRNHLASMSANKISLSGESTSYDFTTGSGQFFGNAGAIELEAGVWSMWSGDINQDGVITTRDYTSWFNSERAGDSGYQVTDVNLDTQVGNLDYDDWLENSRVGAASSVP